ncbi:polyphosphate kinase 2 family protein [Arthrobacter sp. NyZ413]|uniref:polyphosphate kinase 2 family protein n=1 Tax=Arthrobacter sp. NyZ413 TaxID=3144669 RepID=UPI003BF8D1F7
MGAVVEFKKSPSKILKVGRGFELSGVDPQSTPGYPGKKEAGVALLAGQDHRLDVLQEMLFAQGLFGNPQRLLLILQAMDTAGKGGIVEHVVGSMDPQGVKVAPFKAPSEEEKAHDFLWRIEKALPGPGFVGVFDRSHYEDVLIHRVHGWADAAELERRYKAINEFEARLSAEGTTIVKVMLHISRDEQKERLLARLDDPSKHWKYSPVDLTERAFWNSYMDAYQIVFDKTSTEVAPWHVIPANKKWYARIAVQELLLETLAKMDLAWPKATFNVPAERARAVQS